MDAGDLELQLRNVRRGGRRTTMRLENAVWDAFDDVLRREGLTQDALIARIDRACGGGNLSAAVRVYVMDYFRRLAAATGRPDPIHAAAQATPQAPPLSASTLTGPMSAND